MGGIVEVKIDDNLVHHLLTYFAKTSKRSAHALVPYVRLSISAKHDEGTQSPFTHYT